MSDDLQYAGLFKSLFLSRDIEASHDGTIFFITFNSVFSVLQQVFGVGLLLKVDELQVRDIPNTSKSSLLAFHFRFWRSRCGAGTGASPMLNNTYS